MPNTDHPPAPAKRVEPLSDIEEETLSDGSMVYNVHVPAFTLYCVSEDEAIEATMAVDLVFWDYQGEPVSATKQAELVLWRARLASAKAEGRKL